MLRSDDAGRFLFFKKNNNIPSCLADKPNTHLAPREKSKLRSMTVSRSSQDLTWELSHKTESGIEKAYLCASFFFFFSFITCFRGSQL